MWAVARMEEEEEKETKEEVWRRRRGRVQNLGTARQEIGEW